MWFENERCYRSEPFMFSLQVADAPFPIKEGQAPGGEDPDHPWELDAHSLVRDFFGEPGVE